jgi:hypothetical protein
MTTSPTTEQAQALLPLTPAQIEGPYFRLGAPRRDSLLEAASAASICSSGVA